MRDKVKRFISILMTALMLVNLMPVGALAEGVMISNSVQSRASETQTLQTDKRHVYVYARVPDATDEQKKEWQLNADKWYFIGICTLDFDMPNGILTKQKWGNDWYISTNGVYDECYKKYRGPGVQGLPAYNAVISKLDRSSGNSANLSIPMTSQTIKGYKLEDGVTEGYINPDGSFAWHLDIEVSAAQIAVNYKICYWDNNGNKIAADEYKGGIAGEQTEAIDANNAKQIPGYKYASNDGQKTIEKNGQTVVNVYYEPDVNAKASVQYTTESGGFVNPDATYQIQAATGKIIEKGKLTNKDLPRSIATPKAGYVFDGWYRINKNEEKKVSEDEILTTAEATDNLNKDNNTGLYESTVYHAKFKKAQNLSYTVKYLEKDTNKELHTPVTKTGVTFETVINPADEAIGIDGYNYDSADKEKLTIGTSENVLTLYYTKRNDLSYTVNYLEKVTNKVLHDQKVQGGMTYEDTITSANEKIDISGYNYDSVDPETLTIGTGENVINIYYTKRNDLSYTVNYYWNGTNPLIPIKNSESGTETYGKTVNPDTDVPGYTLVPGQTTSLEIKDDPDQPNVLNLYYYKNVKLKANDTSRVYNGAKQTILSSEEYTVITTLDNQVVETTFDKEINVTGSGTDVGNNYTMYFPKKEIGIHNEQYYVVGYENGKLSITKRPVTLTSETASKTYDGTALTKPIVKVTGDGFVAGEVSDIKATGSVTHVSEGEVTNTITYTTGANFKESNYTIAKNEGKLLITPLGGVVVTIKGQTKTVTYDGEEHTAWKYDVIDISDPLYITAPDEVPNFWNKNAKGASRTDAGTYAMGWEAADFENTNTNFSNVTFVVTDGSLTITKRPVTLTSASDKKVYDGNALTKKEVTVGGDGFAKNEGATYNVTGAQTNVGESKNTFSYTLNEGTKADNYTIEKTEGTLKVTPVTDKVTVTITGLNKTVTYDGKEHSVFGYDVTVSNALYTPKKDMQFNGIDEDMTAKGTDAGTYPMGLEDSDFTNISDNFSKVTFKVTDGSLTITKRPVKLTSATDSKVYDGTALTKPEVAVGGDGFVDGEVTDIKATGSVTYVSEGEVTNTITYTEGEKFKADNYTIEKNEGKLSINPVTDKVTVTITEKSGTVTYDGGDHIVSGYASMTADNELYDVDASVQETPTAAWTVKGKDAGEYPVGIKADDFKNTNGNFTNVKFVVVDGKLTITPAPVTLQAPIQSKTYDGTPLEATQFGHSYLEGVNFADDFASVILTGSQTLVGSSASLITGVIPNEGKKLTNYNFTFVPGTLTVTDGTGDDPVKPENVVTKTHIPKDMGYNLGEPVTFTISVKNIYNTPKTITLTEKANVKFSNGESVIVFNDVPAGETVTAEATYTITSADILAGVFHNTVTADFTGGGSWTAENTVTTAELNTTLNVKKTSDVLDGQKAALGQKITYTIKVQNAGNVPYTNVKVEDPLTGLTETIETLPVGETQTFTTEYVVTEADVLKGSVLNTATATGDEIKDPKSDEPKEPNGGNEVETPTFAPITIKPKDVTATYNGAAITGKDVEITSGKLLEGHKLSAAVVGSGVNAGSYELTLDPEKIKIVDANNKDVSEMYARTILPGKLIINKRSVLITSQSATKTYDGSALTRPAVTITGDGFVPGELAKAEATGSITKVGSTPNAIQYTTTGAFNAANYSIALSVGTLTVTEKPKPEPRRTFNLTINYVYQNGKRAAASYNRGGLKNGETFDITSPVIAGYTASETVVSGTIYNRDIKVTVIYTADGVNLDDYGVPLGLGNITMNVGDCFE